MRIGLEHRGQRALYLRTIENVNVEAVATGGMDGVVGQGKPIVRPGKSMLLGVVRSGVRLNATVSSSVFPRVCRKPSRAARSDGLLI